MTLQLKPISEVSQRATDILIKEIGVVDTLRFLNQFRAGAGNYTKERDQLFQGMSVRDIVAEIKANRKKMTNA
jgi:hypothetical protein